MDNRIAIKVAERSASWPMQPSYAAAFCCVGPECEDPCCGGWDIPLDKETYRKYEQLPSQEFAALVSEFVIVNDPPQPPQLHATLKRTPSGVCPFFRADHLCGIQKEYGPQLLSSTCSIYPRSLSTVAGVLEGSLSLSCPEAARNVLLSADFMQRTGDLFAGAFRTDNSYQLALPKPGPQHDSERAFLQIRQTMIEIVRDRSRPLSQRLLLIGRICEKLEQADSLATETSRMHSFDEVEELLQPSNNDGSEQNLAARNQKLRLEVVFTLADVLMRYGSASRFQDVFWTFVEGIGSPSIESTGSDIDRFLDAESTHYRPFFEANPSILENFLVNYMFQHLFPYGRCGSDSFSPQSIFAEYLEMTTQFAWIKALLVGVASHHKQRFSDDHVVHTIQSFTRAMEHYPTVISWVNQHVASRGLNTLQGMSLLLGD